MSITKLSPNVNVSLAVSITDLIGTRIHKRGPTLSPQHKTFCLMDILKKEPDSQLEDTARSSSTIASTVTVTTEATTVAHIPVAVSRSAWRGFRKFVSREQQSRIIEWLTSNASKDETRTFQLMFSSIYKFYKREAREDLRPKEAKKKDIFNPDEQCLPVPRTKNNFDFQTTQHYISDLVDEEYAPLIHEWLMKHATKERRDEFFHLVTIMNAWLSVSKMPKTTYSSQFRRRVTRPSKRMTDYRSPLASTSLSMDLPQSIKERIKGSDPLEIDERTVDTPVSSISKGPFLTYDDKAMLEKEWSREDMLRREDDFSMVKKRQYFSSPDKTLEGVSQSITGKTEQSREYFWKAPDVEDTALLEREREKKLMMKKDLLHRRRPYYVHDRLMEREAVMRSQLGRILQARKDMDLAFVKFEKDQAVIGRTEKSTRKKKQSLSSRGPLRKKGVGIDPFLTIHGLGEKPIPSPKGPTFKLCDEIEKVEHGLDSIESGECDRMMSSLGLDAGKYDRGLRVKDRYGDEDAIRKKGTTHLMQFPTPDPKIGEMLRGHRAERIQRPFQWSPFGRLSRDFVDERMRNPSLREKDRPQSALG